MCDHRDSIGMPGPKGLMRCRSCNRDWHNNSGLLVTFREGIYIFASNRQPV